VLVLAHDQDRAGGVADDFLGGAAQESPHIVSIGDLVCRTFTELLQVYDNSSLRPSRVTT
jgi:hypothetical protein